MKYLVYQLPAIEVHAGQFAIVGFSYVDVEGLALVNIGSSICSHLYDSLLRDLPHRLIQLLQVIWYCGNVLQKKKRHLESDKAKNKKSVISLI